MAEAAAASAPHGKRFRFGQTSRGGHENVLLKVLNREHSGVFASGLASKSRELPFREVPEHLHFCLKEIVPYCYLQGHVFMGLTACGQFLISYKASADYDEVITNEYNFSSNYKYELYFWIYRPHFLLSKYFQVCLFDDHGVDDIKTVSMTQWKTDQRLLLVHGASEKDDCDSYVTVVQVPTLGCLDCRKLRDESAEEDGDENRQDILCIKCNMTIHTKYRNSDSGPRFNPRYNLNCPGFIIMSENSFIHTVNIRLDMSRCPPRRPAASSAVLSSKYISRYPPRESTPPKEQQPKVPILAPPPPQPAPTPSAAEPHTSLSIADQIIADFAEYETESCESRCPPVASRTATTRLSSTSSSSTTTKTTYPENFDELVITCPVQQPLRPSSMVSPPPNVRLMNHRTNTNIELRITSPEGGGGQTPKSYVTRVDLQATNGSSSANSSSGCSVRTPLRRRSYLATNPSSRSPTESSNVPSTSNAAAAKAYEFSEDTEPGEKISTFRKRRLADKKYEFSEDSSHGESVIVPFNRLRARGQTPAGFEMTTHLHRASPSHGFRSPCGSPVGNRYLRSPPGIRSPNYYRHHSPVATPSSNPRPQTAAQLIKMSNFDPKDYIYSGHSTTTASSNPEDIPKFFIDAIHKFNEKKLQAAAAEANNENFNSDNLLPTLKSDPVQVKPEKPVCSKKIVKIFVEEDDANSVVTTEEDDCISPGYHTSLPMEVHGSCYSTMQIISPASFQKLHCPAVVVTQNSFDMETFSFHVANHICAKSDKKYGILFDSAYELTHVCPLTETVTCTMVLQFTASDTNKASKCHNCLTTIDCPTHRKIYQCRSLFTWNMSTGVWTVLDYGHLGNGPYLELKKLASNYNRLLGELRYFTRKLFGKDSDAQDMARTYEYLGHLRVLDCNNEKTKQRLVDLVHMIEFYRKQRRAGGSDDSEEEDEDSEDDDSISTVGSDRDDANTVVGEAGLTSDTVSDEDDN